MNAFSSRGIGIALTVAGALFAVPAAAVDWSAVESKPVLMFQPGQSAWEWVVVPARHDGARRMREGRNCLYCHENEERVIGAAIGSGERLEPDPMPGMPPVVELDVQMARDTVHWYVRVSWAAVGSERPAGLAKARTRFTVMFGGDAIPTTAIAGCWMSCHADLPTMPDTAAGADLTKYLPNSRTRMTATGGGENRKGAPELAAELAQGRVLEYMQVELAAGGSVRAHDGYVLDARHDHETPAATATAHLDNGRWTVEFKRPLAPGGTHLALDTGGRYTVSMALHANHAEGRHHYVAFPVSMEIGAGEADFVVR